MSMSDINIVVTSGGTEEPIDSVRSITNKSTGALGSLIAQGFAGTGARVYYIYNGHTPPTHANIIAYNAPTTALLEDAVTKYLSAKKIDAFIHAMAVSDYRVLNQQEAKIPSTKDIITLTLKRNNKIIDMIKPISPQTILVGFKLMVGSCEDQLHDAACRLMERTGAAYVVANDLYNIEGDKHQAFLVARDGEFTVYTTKQDIADGVVERVMEKLGGM